MNRFPVRFSKSVKTVLLVPGIGNSGLPHWQSHWESTYDAFVRVQQRDWDNPVCADWMESLEASVRLAGDDSVIVAHSLGCLLTTHWLSHTMRRIAGILLVAVPNPDGPDFPSAAVGFAPLPTGRISCPSIVVASANDRYSEIAFAQDCATAWGSRFVNIGAAGHINGDSGLGDWNDGQRLLHELVQGKITAV